MAEKGVAHIPGGLLDALPPEAGLTGHVSRAGVQPDGGDGLSSGQPVLPAAQGGELLHKPLVPVRFRPPQLVVVVGGGQGEVQLVAEAVEDMEHGDGVRSAGYGAQHRGPRGDQVLLPDEALYLSQHSGTCLSM